jgi:hypothetical protein
VEVLQHSALLLPLILLGPFTRFMIKVFLAIGNIYMPGVRRTLRVRVFRLDEFPFFILHMDVQMERLCANGSSAMASTSVENVVY